MSTVIKMDTDLVSVLADDLADTVGHFSAGVSRGVNFVAGKVRETSVREVVSQVNLKESYVDPKITIGKTATPEDTVATIETPVRGVMLGNFGAQQQTVSNVWTAAMYAEAFGTLKAEVRPNPKAGKMPWTPRTGDPLRAIAPGAKQAGIRVAVKAAGAVSTLSHVFFMPMKNQDGKFGTFSRPKGGGKAKAKYGPSVDQVVKGVWRDATDEISGMLGETVLEEVTNELTKGLIK